MILGGQHNTMVIREIRDGQVGYHSVLMSVLNVKALVGAFNKEKALVEAFSVNIKLYVIVCKLYWRLLPPCHCHPDQDFQYPGIMRVLITLLYSGKQY